jgi:glucan biosynthesis protein C
MSADGSRAGAGGCCCGRGGGGGSKSSCFYRPDGACKARISRRAALIVFPVAAAAAALLCSFLPILNIVFSLIVAGAIMNATFWALRADPNSPAPAPMETAAQAHAPAWAAGAAVASIEQWPRAAFDGSGGTASALASAPAAAVSAARPRLVYIDNLKTCVTAIVILHHVLGAFVGAGSLGLSVGNFRNELQPFLSWLQLLDQSWFMCAFFFLAGLVAPPSLRRKGARGFMIDRLRRLGVPFVIYFWGVSPGLTAFVDLVIVGRASSYAPSPGPPWFLSWLLIYSGILALVSDGGRAEPEFLECARPSLAAACGVGALLGLVQLVQMAFLPALFLMPISWSSFPFHCTFFFAGVLACRNGWLAEEGPGAQPPQQARAEGLAAGAIVVAHAALAAVCFAGAYMGLVGGLLTSTNACGELPSRGAQDAGFFAAFGYLSVGGGVFAVAALVASLALFRARCGGRSAASDFLNSHAFACYLVHPVVVVPLTGAFVVIARQRTGAGAFTNPTGVDFSDCVGGDGAAGALLAGFAAVAALSLPLTLAVAVVARKLPLLRDLL